MTNTKKVKEIVASSILNVPSTRKIIVFGLIVILVFFGVFGSWAALAPISGAVIAPGSVVVGTKRKIVQHREGGIVDKIFVRDGDIVEKDQILVILRDAQVESNVEILQGQLDAVVAKYARLVAERDSTDSIEWPDSINAKYTTDPDIQKIMDAEKRVFITNKASIDSQTSLIDSQIDQMRKQIEGYRAYIVSLETILKSLREEFNAKNTLLKQDYIGKLPILELDRTIAENEGAVARATQGIAQSEERIAELGLKRSDLLKDFERRVSTDLSDAEAKMIDLRERLNPQIDARSRLEIKAPSAGVIVNMADFSIDGVIKSGQDILEIVPEGEPLIVESSIKPQDINEVYVGQHAKIQLNAYDASKVEPVPAKVSYVSADSILQKYAHGEMAVFKIHLVIDQDALEEQDIIVSPGMPVTAYVTTKPRTPLSYIFEPFIKRVREALRD